MFLEQVAVSITEETHVSGARRAALRMVRDLAFDEASEGRLAIVVSELARNVLLHGGGGDVILQPRRDNGCAEMLVIAMDKGRGIADVARALRDGYSSAGTAGTGFGAVSRLSSLCDFYTKPGEGTVFLASVSCGTRPGGTRASTTGAVCVPVAGEDRCGDAWACEEQAGRRVIMVADGLGHGPLAAEAAQESIAAFQENWTRSPREILTVAHGRLQKTRGAAVAVTEIDFRSKLVRHSGIGNISAAIVHNGKSRSLISHNGIVGHQVDKIQEFTMPWEKNGLLIMHSDGINTRWTLDRYAGVQNKPAALVAALLYRDFKRGRDDATVVVSREAEAA